MASKVTNFVTNEIPGVKTKTSTRPATKGSAKANEPLKRMCIHCHNMKPAEDFKPNKDWVQQQGRDLWCIECCTKISTKDDLKRYFWENNRVWSEDLWAKARSEAADILENKPIYRNAPDSERNKMMMAGTCNLALKYDNMPAYYKYEQHDDNGTISYEEAKNTGFVVRDEEDTTRNYSEFFNGYFKKSDLRYLERYYNSLDSDYDLDTENLKDYARKLAKQSLQVDKAQDDYAAGRCDYSVVKDAMNIFDMLSKSANFAACKRKQKDADAGQLSVAEIGMQLELNGHPCMNKIEFEKDDIDMLIGELTHITRALGLNE